jgi:hypothetical protein
VQEKNSQTAYLKDKTMDLRIAVTIGLTMAALLTMGALAKDDVSKDKANHEAISQKLKAAVKAGELSEKEAWAKWKALTKGDKKAQTDATHAYIEKVWQKLQAEVKAGNMTEAEALKKIIAIKKAKLGDKKGNLTLVWDALQTHVKAGHLTPAQAKAAMIAIKTTEAKPKTY